MDPRILGAVRMGVGLAALVRAFEGWAVTSRVLAPGRVADPFFAELPRIPLEALPGLVALWATAALLFLVGWHTRLAGSVLCGVIAYVIALDRQLYASHLYLMGLLCALLTLGGSGAALSVDALRRGTAAPRRIPSWPASLLRAQLAIVYGFAALAKINTVYLSGAVIRLNFRRDGALALPDALLTAPAAQALAIGSIGVEAFLALALWSPRWRPAAFVVGPLFHLSMLLCIDAAVAWQIGVFAVEMLSLYLLFVPEATFARIVGLYWGPARAGPLAPEEAACGR
jgi:hypothetical protein